MPAMAHQFEKLSGMQVRESRAVTKDLAGRGDVVASVALRFFVRKEGDGERRTFTDTLEEGTTQLCSASELRLSWPPCKHQIYFASGG